MHVYHFKCFLSLFIYNSLFHFLCPLQNFCYKTKEMMSLTLLCWLMTSW